MYGKEKQVRKELRIKQFAFECAKKRMKDRNNPSFNNYVETLIIEDCKNALSSNTTV